MGEAAAHMLIRDKEAHFELVSDKVRDSSVAFLTAGLPDSVRRLEESGQFDEATRMIERILARNKSAPDILKSRLRWEPERLDRIRKDYSLTEEEAFRSLRTKIPDLSIEEFRRWIEEYLVEHREIDGKRMIFNSFMPNFMRDSSEAQRRAKNVDDASDRARKLLHRHIDDLMTTGENSSSRYTNPLRNRIQMTLKVRPDVVPDGELVRVWLPFPRTGPLQREATVVSSSPEDYVLSPSESPQRTIYFEAEASKGRELEFSVQYEYVALASRMGVNSAKAEQGGETDPREEYVSEQLPHIAFTPYLRRVAGEIVSGEQNQYQKAWRIYSWITENLRYALVPEYSTIECISDYAARNLRGDCGVMALLFITLCRISGVPARWQSGWQLNPIRQSPHDWAQFYVEPQGWLYADPSFGGHEISNERYHRFYFGSIDHFRLVANADICSDFYPSKTHYRSDAVDNQRGETEWTGGNVYFDGFTSELKLLSQGPAEDEV